MSANLPTQMLFGNNEWFRYVMAETTSFGVYISWNIYEDRFSLNDPPFIFTLLRSTEYTNDINAFSVVQDNLEDTYSYVDHDPLTIGKWSHVYYKIKLDTSLQTVYSPTITIYGGLTPRQRRIARAIIRKIHLSPRHLPLFTCTVLTRKRTGTPCTCLDPVTKEVLNPDCLTCYGTGYVGGYHIEGVPKTIIALSSALNNLEMFDATLRMGTTTVSRIQAKFAGLPILRTQDAIVHTKTNRRFYVVASGVSAEIEGFPLVQDVELQLADFKDVLYKFPV